MHKIEAKTILSAKNGMNIYRGCSHACIYCDSRSKCYGMDHAFEDIAVKSNAPELLRQALKKKRHLSMIGTGAMTDPYLPEEKTLGYTRECLKIIAQYGFGATVLTKSDLVLRDLDIIKEIKDKAKAVIQMTITTLDDELCSRIEPNVCPTSRRFEVLKTLRDNNIPTVVWLCPILPFINDTEENIKGIVERCAEAGVYGILCFGMGLTLREGNREYFYRQLDLSFPGLKQVYRQKYGDSYQVTSPKQRALMSLFYSLCHKYGIKCRNDEIFQYLQDFPCQGEESLFPEF
ncbi:MAG: radical SAM protein [Bacillota bacterium]|nr:radical SAM protein [Bacillota bacterium]